MQKIGYNSHMKDDNNVLYVYKPVGKTPLEVVDLLKKRHLQYKDEVISYAGRLDPMAEGVMVVLVGEANKRRHMFENRRKTYRVDVLLGFETDTYDALGLTSSSPCPTNFTKEEIKKAALSYQKKFIQEFPPYSSKTVNGKPLYYWARENRLDEIALPARPVEIYSMGLESIATIAAPILLKKVAKEIKNINGDFRQEKILAAWENALIDSMDEFQTATLLVECSAGTYMRSLAHNIGKKLSCGAIALHIVREKVGEVGIKDCIHL